MADLIPGEISTESPGGIFGGPYLPALAIAFQSGLKAFGLVRQGEAAVTAAQRQQQAAQFEAEQLRVNAGQAQAAAQRDAYWKGLEGDRVISAIRAHAGAGATDPTLLNVIAQASAQRAYNMQAALYGGEDKARLMRMQASGREYDAALRMEDAKSARQGANLAAIGALASGGSSIYEKYWPKDKMGQLAPESKLDYENSFDSGAMDAVLNKRSQQLNIRGADTPGVRG